MGAEEEGQWKGGCGGPFLNGLDGFSRVSFFLLCRALGLVNVQGHEEAAEVLFKGLPAEAQMWMSHGDKIHALPPGYVMSSLLSSLFIPCVRLSLAGRHVATRFGRRPRVFGPEMEGRE